MKTNLAGLTMVGVLCVATPVVADPITQDEVQRAQSEMLMRVSDSVELYAQRINIEPGYVTYCYGELNLRTEGHPADGSIPYGVDYGKITDSVYLTQVLSVLTSFDRIYALYEIIG